MTAEVLNAERLSDNDLAEINAGALACVHGTQLVLQTIRKYPGSFGEVRLTKHTTRGSYSTETQAFTTDAPNQAGHEYSVGELLKRNPRTLTNPFRPGMTVTDVTAGEQIWVFEDMAKGSEVHLPVNGFDAGVKLPSYLEGKYSLQSYLRNQVTEFSRRLGIVAQEVGVELPTPQ